MKKIIVFLSWLSLYVVILCVGGMLCTFLNDAIQASNFFGDVAGHVERDGINIDSDHIWGARHYWYFWMCVALFIISVIRIVAWMDWFWSEDNKKKY
mgnify:CR=1 FL=1